MNKHMVVLKALADPTRLKLLKLILAEEMCVCELQEVLQISQPAVSQHVAKLKTAGLITERKAGMWTYYHGAGKHLQMALEDFRTFLQADLAAVESMAVETNRMAALNRVALCCDKGATNP